MRTQLHFMGKCIGAIHSACSLTAVQKPKVFFSPCLYCSGALVNFAAAPPRVSALPRISALERSRWSAPAGWSGQGRPLAQLLFRLAAPRSLADLSMRRARKRKGGLFWRRGRVLGFAGGKERRCGGRRWQSQGDLFDGNTFLHRSRE